MRGPRVVTRGRGPPHRANRDVGEGSQMSWDPAQVCELGLVDAGQVNDPRRLLGMVWVTGREAPEQCNVARGGEDGADPDRWALGGYLVAGPVAQGEDGHFLPDRVDRVLPRALGIGPHDRGRGIVGLARTSGRTKGCGND